MSATARHDIRAGRWQRVVTTLCLGAIAAYRRLLSPVLPSACRFHPSCSQYAAEAIRVHGPARGLLMAARRLGRCHPWHPGGVDPVR